MFIVVAIISASACSGGESGDAGAASTTTIELTGVRAWLASGEVADRLTAIAEANLDAAVAVDEFDLAAAEEATTRIASDYEWLRDHAPAHDDGTRAAERSVAAFTYCADAFGHARDVFALFQENLVDPTMNRIEECNRLMGLASDVVEGDD